MGDSKQDRFASDAWDGADVFLINDATGTALDMGAGRSPGGAEGVHTWTFSRHNNNQKFRIEKLDKQDSWSAWRLRCHSNQAMLEISGGSDAKGAAVQGWRFDQGNHNQHWYLISRHDDDTLFMLQNRASYTYVDVQRNDKGNGVKIHGWTRGDYKTQVWRFLRV